MRTMTKALAVAGLAAAVLSPPTLVADTDIYGNDIIYESDGVTVKYKFWVSGTKAEVASSARSATASFTPAGTFESRSRTLLSRITTIVTKPWVGLFLIVR